MRWIPTQTKRPKLFRVGPLILNPVVRQAQTSSEPQSNSYPEPAEGRRPTRVLARLGISDRKSQIADWNLSNSHGSGDRIVPSALEGLTLSGTLNIHANSDSFINLSHG